MGKGKGGVGTGYLSHHAAHIRAGEAFRSHSGQKDRKGVGRTEHGRKQLPYGAKALPIAIVLVNAVFVREAYAEAL
jgi:hypothetical protein